MKKYLLSFLILICPLSALMAAPDSERDNVMAIINEVNNYWQSHHGPETPSFWNWAAYHTGNMEACKLTGNKQWLDYSEAWAKHNKWQGATEKDPRKWVYKTYGEDQQHVLFGDWQICFQTYIDLYNIKKDKKRVARAKEVMGYVADNAVHDYWWWADALYMAMPVMTKMYRLTGQEKYLDKMYECISWSDSIMLDTATGLYFRDGRYVYPKHKTNNGIKDFWARGDGWVLAGLAKVLKDMPKNYKHYQFFADKFCKLASAVAASQQPEGYWTRSMLDPQQAPGPETSGTAFFTYGLLWGINNGYLSETDYLPTVSRAWTYLTHTALQQDGSVGYVQPIGDRAIPGQTINSNSQADFGVGAFLLAACEYIHWLDNTANHKQVAITIANSTNRQSLKVVETEASAVRKALGIGSGEPFVLKNKAGQELDYQITHDGKLLIDASVQPNSSWTVYAQAGKPKTPKSWVRGAQYKEREDDLAWENDRCAYRVYGPALQRTGEKSFGIDVWVKSTPEFILDYRYKTHLDGNKFRKPLLQDGRATEAKHYLNTTSFHLDHGYGMDGYGVGPTLGCGAPAYIDGGKLVLPYCYQNFKILDNGPLRFTVRLDFDSNSDGIVEHRIISLDKGSHLNRITVWYDNMQKPVTFCAGVVLNGQGELAEGKNYVAYADPTDRPEVNGTQIYVAALFPHNNVTIGKTPDNRNAVGMISNYKGEPVTYYAGASWSRFDVPSMAIWKILIAEEAEELGNSNITVSVK